jgi:predicted nucleic acid-binding protein
MRGLIDSNVLIAASDADHEHHADSLSFLRSVIDRRFVTSQRCTSETYSNLTRPRRGGGAGFTPSEAMAAIDRIEGKFDILSLTVANHHAALRAFANNGGTGPRVYDFLIGYAALVNGLPLIVTWNTRHFEPLFPSLRVTTPTQYLETL